MFKNISWSSFITAIIILVIIYYIVIGILYFRDDVMRLLKEGIKRKQVVPAPEILADTKGDPTLFPAMHELMNELKDLFFTASGQGYPKEELITALHSKLKTYPILKDTRLATSINEHLIETASSMCHIELDATDMKRIW